VPYELNRSTNERYVSDAIPLRALVQDLTLQMVNMETGVRGYLITGSPEALEPYDQGLAAVNADLIAMRPHLARHPNMDRLVQAALPQIAALEGYFQQQVALASAGPEGRRAAQARIGQGERDFDEFRQTARRMLAETNRVVEQAEEHQRSIYTRLLVVLGVLGSIALAIGGILFLRTPRRLGELYAAEERARREVESRADAARALEHVQDGVVLVDERGVVRFLNPAATSLLLGEPGDRIGQLLPGLEDAVDQAEALGGEQPPVVLPLEVGGAEHWLSVTGVEFGEGTVYAIRDITEERALESLRSEFVATASHELRTPLTGVYGAARTLLRRDLDLTPDQRLTFLEMIAGESERLARIVDDILLANRLDADGIEIETQRCDPYALTRSVVDAARAHAPASVALELEGPDGLPEIACDPDRLRQVLVNVLDNAIKYSPDGGAVAVRLHTNGEKLRFEVRDEGLGFPPGESERIFDRFHRLDPHQRRGIGGTGLGLYICRELVERMNGRIWAESEPGRGASFFFELPLAR
jgi:signal transduction histidine kinase